jgi:hypothetical protein
VIVSKINFVDESLFITASGDDRVIHRVFNRLCKLRLDCHTSFAMTASAPGAILCTYGVLRFGKGLI